MALNDVINPAANIIATNESGSDHMSSKNKANGKKIKLERNALKIIITAES